MSDTERDERLRGIAGRIGNAGPPDEWYCAEEVTEMLEYHGADTNDIGPDAALISAAHADLEWLLSEVTRLDAVVTAVREVHAPQPLLSGQRVIICQCCLYPHPCATVRALDGGAA